jgi:hypothetical protein
MKLYFTLFGISFLIGIIGRFTHLYSYRYFFIFSILFLLLIIYKFVKKIILKKK